MIAVFTEGKAPMQTTINGFAYIYCCGAPGGAIEARIGDKMYGLCVLSDEGYGYISVPEAGTYDLYAQGGTEKLTSVSVTERKKIYRSGLKLPYSFSDMTSDKMAEVISKIKDGKILFDDLPWKIGDKRSIPTTVNYKSGSTTVSEIANSNFEIVGVNEPGKNSNGVTYTDGKPVKYIIKMEPTYYITSNANYPAAYDSETGIPKCLSIPDITSLFKPFSYENLIFKRHEFLKYGYDGSNYTAINEFEIKNEKIISKYALAPFSMYDHSWIFTDKRSFVVNDYGPSALDEGFNAKEVLKDALSKITTNVGIQYHTASDDIVSTDTKTIKRFSATNSLTSSYSISDEGTWKDVFLRTGIFTFRDNTTESYIKLSTKGGDEIDSTSENTWADRIYCI